MIILSFYGAKKNFLFMILSVLLFLPHRSFLYSKVFWLAVPFDVTILSQSSLQRKKIFLFFLINFLLTLKCGGKYANFIWVCNCIFDRMRCFQKKSIFFYVFTPPRSIFYAPLCAQWVKKVQRKPKNSNHHV